MKALACIAPRNTNRIVRYAYLAAMMVEAAERALKDGSVHRGMLPKRISLGAEEFLSLAAQGARQDCYPTTPEFDIYRFAADVGGWQADRFRENRRELRRMLRAAKSLDRSRFLAPEDRPALLELRNFFWNLGAVAENGGSEAMG